MNDLLDFKDQDAVAAEKEHRCSTCKQPSHYLHKRGGAVYCPECLEEYQRITGRR